MNKSHFIIDIVKEDFEHPLMYDAIVEDNLQFVKKNWSSKTELTLMLAAEFSSFNVLKWCMTQFDPKSNDSSVLRYAVRKNSFKAVEVLLPLSNASADQNFPFEHACAKGYFDLVKLIYPYIDAANFNNMPLRLAWKSGHLEIVEYLYEKNEVQRKIKDFFNHYSKVTNPSSYVLEAFSEITEISNYASQRKALLNVLNDHMETAPDRKKKM